MKVKALMLAVFVAGLTASFALAGDGHGKHGGTSGMTVAPATTSSSKAAKPCRPRLELELAGTVASTSGDSLALLVSRGHARGAQLKDEQLTLDISQARVRGDVAAGSKVRVHARACIDLVAGTAKLVAVQVRGDHAKAGDHDTTSSTTTTTTTEAHTAQTRTTG